MLYEINDISDHVWNALDANMLHSVEAVQIKDDVSSRHVTYWWGKASKCEKGSQKRKENNTLPYLAPNSWIRLHPSSQALEKYRSILSPFPWTINFLASKCLSSKNRTNGGKIEFKLKVSS